MYARVARFEGAEADGLRRSVDEIKARADSGPPEGVPAKGFLLLVDPEKGQGLAISLFDTEEDLKAGRRGAQLDEPTRRRDGPPVHGGDVRGRRGPQGLRVRQGAARYARAMRAAKLKRRARLGIMVAVGLLALTPSTAGAAKLRSFELPSPLVDTSAPGGELEAAAPSRRSTSCCRTATRPLRSAAIPCSGCFTAPTAARTPGFPALADARGRPARGSSSCPTAGSSACTPTGGTAARVATPPGPPTTCRLLRRTIERRYPIRPGRRWHAIGGISMGGQGTLRYAAMLPGYFGSAVGFSAAFPDTQSRDGTGRPDAARGGQRCRRRGYEAIFGPAAARLRRGQQPAGAGAQLRPHPPLPDVRRRDQLPPGPGGPSSIALDGATELSSTLSRARSPPPSAPRART